MNSSSDFLISCLSLMTLFFFTSFDPAYAVPSESIFEDGFECPFRFRDIDEDGFGTQDDFVQTCSIPEGYVVEGTDCNDNNSNIHPGAPDRPDAAYLDSNCDGIDGNISKSVFVSNNGLDSNTGTMDSPFLTIGKGISEAVTKVNTRDVLVASAFYNENISLPDGISLYGQYSSLNWTRSPAYLTTVVAISGEVALRVNDYSSTGSVQGFKLVSETAPRLENSISVVLENVHAGFSLQHNEIVALNASNGLPGNNGKSQDGEDGDGGEDGSIGSNLGGNGGTGGKSLCRAFGGSGGRGGYDQSDGENGQTDWTSTSGIGVGGIDMNCFTGGSNNGSIGGTGSAGIAGYSGKGGGFGKIDGSGWLATAGENGTPGTHGAGGAGGGGGGGGHADALCKADRGGGGGGGGAGGCGGTEGHGGLGGGGSIAILLISTNADISNNKISTGNGGKGGNGGDGGAGGLGGAGGPGGASADDAGAGGAGAHGANGGTGGCGGGGAGGISIGIVRDAVSSPTLNSNNFDLGSGGDGGLGGVSPLGGTCEDGVTGQAIPEYTF